MAWDSGFSRLTVLGCTFTGRCVCVCTTMCTHACGSRYMCVQCASMYGRALPVLKLSQLPFMMTDGISILY